MVNHRPKKFTEIKSPHVFQGRAKEIPNWGIVRGGTCQASYTIPITSTVGINISKKSDQWMRTIIN